MPSEPHDPSPPRRIPATRDEHRSGGVEDPATTTVARRPASIRRTSHIDIELADARVALTGAARDLVTDESEAAHEAGAATVRAEVDRGGRLAALTTTPARAETGELLGQSARGGFRAALGVAMPTEAAAATPLFLLLDDLPVATLISGYASLYTGEIGSDGASAGAVKADICAGWHRDGTMMVSIRDHGRIPVPVGPVAPRLEPDDDPLAWHRIGPLATGAMRRRRLVDVAVRDVLEVQAMFRDTHVGPDGTETVLHEYSLTANVDPDSLVVMSCAATPRVLPWIECPRAADSARALIGTDLRDVRELVRAELRGTSTCTHLNDLLRSLGDVPALADRLRSGAATR